MFGIGIAELLIIGFVLVVPLVIIVVVLVVVSSGRKTQGPNPNLMPCPECQGLVSIRAASCPKCGCALKSADDT